MISGIALLVASLALCVSLGQLVHDLLKHPRPNHGPEVENLDATFERAAAKETQRQRRSEMPDDTVPLIRPGTVYRGRYRRRG